MLLSILRYLFLSIYQLKECRQDLKQLITAFIVENDFFPAAFAYEVAYNFDLIDAIDL